MKKFVLSLAVLVAATFFSVSAQNVKSRPKAKPVTTVQKKSSAATTAAREKVGKPTVTAGRHRSVAQPILKQQSKVKQSTLRQPKVKQQPAEKQPVATPQPAARLQNKATVSAERKTTKK
jgi:hypothetical protein